MSVRTQSGSGQRLPTEVILTIFEHAIDKRPWQVQTLTLVSKKLRTYLLRRLFQQLHLRSMERLDSLIIQDWPSHSSKKGKSQPTKLALYLHFLYKMEDEDDFYDELLDRIEDIPSNTRNKIETLGVRTLPSNKAYLSLGLWTCNLLKNLRRLYVDSSLLPPFGDGEKAENILHRMENLPPKPRPGNPNELPLILTTHSTQLEAYAYVGSSLGAVFGHLEGLAGQRRFIKEVFPNLKRLYLFTLAWQQDGSDMHDQLDLVATDFGAVTNVNFIANIVIQGKEPASWCAPECSMYGYPNGTMIIRHVVVDQPENQDMLALMHRIIDDIDAEWVPEAFSGKKWDPSTRPRYTTGIPTRSTFKREGVTLPRRVQ